MSELKNIQDRAEQDAREYWQRYQGMHLDADQLELVAEHRSHTFAEGYGKRVTKEQRLAYKIQFAALYLDLEHNRV